MARRQPAPVLHDLEREVMDVIWRRDTATTVREVLEAVNARNRRTERAYTTIMTTVHRLEDKGMLLRDGSTRSHRFRPAMSPADYAVRRADALVAELGDQALAAFTKRVDELDDARRDKLRRLAAADG